MLNLLLGEKLEYFTFKLDEYRNFLIIKQLIALFILVDTDYFLSTSYKLALALLVFKITICIIINEERYKIETNNEDDNDIIGL